MGKEKLRFGDIWNRWYTWVLAILLMFVKSVIYETSRTKERLDYFIQVTDEAGIYCATEFPGVFSGYYLEEIIAIFLANLFYAFVTILIIYAIINKLRKTK